VCWNRCCAQIASHPEVQAKIAAELDSMGLLVTPERPVPRDMVLEDLRQLPYLTACVKEGAWQAAAARHWPAGVQQCHRESHMHLWQQPNTHATGSKDDHAGRASPLSFLHNLQPSHMTASCHSCPPSPTRSCRKP
jgi:hypothetical protein